MLLTIQDLINTLRFDLNIYNSQTGVSDSGLLDMTDEQIITQIKLGASRLYPDLESLDDLEDGCEYPLTLLAKIELVTTLATLKADMVDMNADNNNHLSLGQRWEHYKGLLDLLNDMYNKWSTDENGGAGVVTSYNVLLDNRHFTRRNYNEQQAPKVKLSIKNITTNSADVEWGVTNSVNFGMYRVYLGQGELFDVYREGAYAGDKVTENARLLKTSINIRDNHIKLKNLERDTSYNIAVVAIERNQVFGYKEKIFTTLEDLDISNAENGGSVDGGTE